MSQNNLPSSLAILLSQLNAQGASEQQKYKAVKEYLNLKARNKGIPISGSFELTPLCNLDCKMCYVHLDKNQLKQAHLLDPNEWKSIMKQAISAGLMYARLTGGECLTYPGFKDLYLFLLEKGIETTILTNGLRLDDAMVSFFNEHKPAAIQLSLYGVSEDAYERVTGIRAFRTVSENIDRVIKADIPLTIAITPNSYMEDGINIIRYARSKNLPYQINSGLMMPREETGRAPVDLNIKSYTEMMKYHISAAKNIKDNFSVIDPDSLPDPGSTQATSKTGVTCAAGRSAFAINWKGQMLPCNTFPCDPVSVLEIGFAEAWKITNHTANNYPLPQECEGCTYKSICKHCVAEHASGAPCGHANPSICEWAKAMVSEGLLTLQPVEI